MPVIGPRPWKVRYKPTDRSRERAATYACALAGWGSWCTTSYEPPCAAVNVMVWDHCHVHGFIRGPLCAYHNGRMRHFDDGWEEYVFDPVLIDYSWRCAGCAPPW